MNNLTFFCAFLGKRTILYPCSLDSVHNFYDDDRLFLWLGVGKANNPIYFVKKQLLIAVNIKACNESVLPVYVYCRWGFFVAIFSECYGKL